MSTIGQPSEEEDNAFVLLLVDISHNNLNKWPTSFYCLTVNKYDILLKQIFQSDDTLSKVKCKMLNKYTVHDTIVNTDEERV